MQETLLKLISLGSLVLISLCLFFIVLNILGMADPLKRLINQKRIHILFFVSFGATVGSLMLSIYFKLVACELCWYQRLFLFSSPVIAYIAILKKHTQAYVYIFWLSCLGLSVAIYHSLLQSKIFTSDAIFCNPGSVVDCSIPSFVYYGFVTVPVISLSVFLLLVLISYDYKKI